MYLLNNMQPIQLDETTFAELSKKESDVEEMLRKNVDIICDDEESMLIVGQQVKDMKNSRSDLTAIDNNGGIVLIEIKRDKRDIEGRKEAFEFQAIRYAASCAAIKTTEVLIRDVFGPYVEKHKSEFSSDSGLTSTEIAQRQLKDFFDRNGIKSFNDHQRIILVASQFDEQTLSAVAWLNSNNVNISCYQICLFRHGKEVFFNSNKILPVAMYEDFYVNVTSRNSIVKGQKSFERRVLPKIDYLMEKKVVQPGDVLQAKGTDDEAVLQPSGQVKTSDGKIESIQQWLKKVYGWSSVETYAFAKDKKTGKTLAELREICMEKEAQEESELQIVSQTDD